MCTGGSLALAAAAAALGNTCSRHNKYTVWISFFWNTALRQWVMGFRRVEAAECDSTMTKAQ
jgi:hypothetical protein